jgi:D-inositol-3-phosphate glycosyltransferase
MMRNRRRIKRAWFNVITRRNLEHASAIGMLADGEVRDLRLLGVSNRCVVVPNGFKISTGFRSRSSVENVKPYIIFLGYLDPRKQPDFLIRAYSSSQARMTHELFLVGPDGYGFEPELRRIANDLGVPGRVRFLGSREGGEKWELLSAASLLCLPSKAEGYPLVLIEAAAVGTPSLFSKACNAADLASAGAGIELEGSNIDEWARAIDAILGDDALSKKLRASALIVSEDYAWKNIAHRWLDIYSHELRNTSEV